MFRRITLIVLVVVLSLSVAVTPAAARTETFHSKIKGLFAEAIFSSFDETGCIETFVALSVQENRRKADGSPEVETIAIITAYQFDHCAGEFLLLTAGEPNVGPFVIDKQLNQATLTTEFSMRGLLNEGDVHRLEINLTWTGVGETSTTKEHVQIKEPGFQLNLHFMGTTREAQASGTVTVDGINFTPEPAIDALLGDIKSGEVQIVHDV